MWWITGFILYVVIGCVFYKIVSMHEDCDLDNDDAVAMTVFWVITLPVALIIILVTLIYYTISYFIDYLRNKKY